MTVFATLLAMTVTVSAIVWLVKTDPKRRRVFGLSPYDGPRHAGAALTLVFLPGLALVMLNNGAALVVWLGATTVVGWGIVAVTPGQAASLNTSTLGALSRIRAFAGLSRDGARKTAAALLALRGMKSRIAELEARVAALEQELGHDAMAGAAEPQRAAVGLVRPAEIPPEPDDDRARETAGFPRPTRLSSSAGPSVPS